MYVSCRQHSCCRPVAKASARVVSDPRPGASARSSGLPVTCCVRPSSSRRCRHPRASNARTPGRTPRIRSSRTAPGSLARCERDIRIRRQAEPRRDGGILWPTCNGHISATSRLAGRIGMHKTFLTTAKRSGFAKRRARVRRSLDPVVAGARHVVDAGDAEFPHRFDRSPGGHEPAGHGRGHGRVSRATMRERRSGSRESGRAIRSR